MKRFERLPVFSRFLHWIDERASRTSASVVVASLVVIALAVIAASGFDVVLQADFATACGAVTLIMVFVLQHTQRRAQLATQLKLDEIIAALPAADDRVMHVETSANEELSDMDRQRTLHHQRLRSDGTTAEPPDR